jgi:hypothetical protein
MLIEEDLVCGVTESYQCGSILFVLTLTNISTKKESVITYEIFFYQRK